MNKYRINVIKCNEMLDIIISVSDLEKAEKIMEVNKIKRKYFAVFDLKSIRTSFILYFSTNKIINKGINNEAGGSGFMPILNKNISAYVANNIISMPIIYLI